MKRTNFGEFVKSDSIKKAMSWLIENYEYAEGVSIPRNVLYGNYIKSCSARHCSGISSATFGKIIRQQFPQITTRRLGTRGHSKYHYHGLAVKESSMDFDPAFARSASTDTEVHPVSVLHPKTRSECAPSVKLAIPNIEDLPKDGIKSDIKNFLVMYHIHSQQMLDSIIQGSFGEVAKFLGSFWRSCPDNFKYLFDNGHLISCVVFLDVQVYLSVSHSVLPSMDQLLPETYLQEFVSFLCNFTSILTTEIEDSYRRLKNEKLKYATIFKQLCINWLKASHMVQILLPILSDTEVISQILEDLQMVSLDDVIYHVVCLMPESERLQFANHFHYYFEDLENIVEMNLTVKEVLCWCQSIYSHEWTKDIRQIFLGWSRFLATFLADFLIHRPASFGHVHLIFMWLEHLLYTQCTIARLESVRFSSEELIDYDSYIISNIATESPITKIPPQCSDTSYGLDKFAHGPEYWNSRSLQEHLDFLEFMTTDD